MDNLFFTDEHIMIRDMVREFADSEITPVARGLDEQEKFPRDLVDKMGELGLMGIIIPEEYGVSGHSRTSPNLAETQTASSLVGIRPAVTWRR